MSEAWIILVVTLIVGYFVAPYIKNKFFTKHPDTYVSLYGLNKSYSLPELRSISPKRSKITIRPIRLPKGTTEVSQVWVPVKLFSWKFPENHKLYSIVAHNKGGALDRNIKISIRFFPDSSIETVEIRQSNRVDTIEGGQRGSNFAVFKINELLPDEKQEIVLLTKGNNLESIDSWSQEKRQITNILIYDLIIEPDKDPAKNVHP